MIQTLIPVGLRGLLLAALFGAIQSTVNSVLNSTSTVFTLDIWKRYIRPEISERQIVRMGMGSSVVILLIAIVLAGNISRFGGSLFVYIQTLYNFFGPPFSAIFVTGLVWKRINARGATAAVLVGFVFGILLKIYVGTENHALWVEPYSVQGILIWAVSVLVSIAVSLMTPPPPAEQVSRELAFQWGNLRLFTDLGDRWYKNVVLWWLLAVSTMAALYITFSGRFF
jgi:SSS family solute:Na+ symporter